MAAVAERVIPHNELTVGTVYKIYLSSGKAKKVRYDGLNRHGEF